MKKTALIAVLFSVNVIVASHDDSMSQRHLKPITNVKIIADLVTTDSQILKFKPGIGQYKETPTPEEVKRINDRLLQAKAVLDMALKDPFLINQGLQDFMEVRQVNLIATGMSQSFDGVIVINPLFKQTNDDLIDTLIHEQLHAIVHNKQNHIGTENVKAKIMERFEKGEPGKPGVPNIAAELINKDEKNWKVPGVNPLNKGCLPPKPLEQCTSEHMLVNWLEMRAMELLWGKTKATEHFDGIIKSHGVYAGIYEWLRIPENSKVVEDAVSEARLAVPGIKQIQLQNVK